MHIDLRPSGLLNHLCFLCLFVANKLLAGEHLCRSAHLLPIDSLI